MFEEPKFKVGDRVCYINPTINPEEEEPLRRGVVEKVRSKELVKELYGYDSSLYHVRLDNGVHVSRFEWGLEKENNMEETVKVEIGKETDEDLVNSPKHYTDTSMECIDAMLLILGYEYTIAHCIGTAFKYLWRYRNKENPQRDLDKARWYVDKGISLCYKVMLDSKIANKVDDKFLLERLNILSKQIDKYDDELYEEAKKREEEEEEENE